MEVHYQANTSSERRRNQPKSKIDRINAANEVKVQVSQWNGMLLKPHATMKRDVTQDRLKNHIPQSYHNSNISFKEDNKSTSVLNLANSNSLIEQHNFQQAPKQNGQSQNEIFKQIQLSNHPLHLNIKGQEIKSRGPSHSYHLQSNASVINNLLNVNTSNLNPQTSSAKCIQSYKTETLQPLHCNRKDEEILQNNYPQIYTKNNQDKSLRVPCRNSSTSQSSKFIRNNDFFYPAQINQDQKLQNQKNHQPDNLSPDQVNSIPIEVLEQKHRQQIEEFQSLEQHLESGNHHLFSQYLLLLLQEKLRPIVSSSKLIESTQFNQPSSSLEVSQQNIQSSINSQQYSLKSYQSNSQQRIQGKLNGCLVPKRVEVNKQIKDNYEIKIQICHEKLNNLENELSQLRSSKQNLDKSRSRIENSDLSHRTSSSKIPIQTDYQAQNSQLIKELEQQIKQMAELREQAENSQNENNLLRNIIKESQQQEINGIFIHTFFHLISQSNFLFISYFTFNFIVLGGEFQSLYMRSTFQEREEQEKRAFQNEEEKKKIQIQKEQLIFQNNMLLELVEEMKEQLALKQQKIDEIESTVAKYERINNSQELIISHLEVKAKEELKSDGLISMSQTKSQESASELNNLDDEIKKLKLKLKSVNDQLLQAQQEQFNTNGIIKIQEENLRNLQNQLLYKEESFKKVDYELNQIQSEFEKEKETYDNLKSQKSSLEEEIEQSIKQLSNDQDIQQENDSNLPLIIRYKNCIKMQGEKINQNINEAQNIQKEKEIISIGRDQLEKEKYQVDQERGSLNNERQQIKEQLELIEKEKKQIYEDKEQLQRDLKEISLSQPQVQNSAQFSENSHDLHSECRKKEEKLSGKINQYKEKKHVYRERLKSTEQKLVEIQKRVKEETNILRTRIESMEEEQKIIQTESSSQIADLTAAKQQLQFDIYHLSSDLEQERQEKENIKAEKYSNLEERNRIIQEKEDIIKELKKLLSKQDQENKSALEEATRERSESATDLIDSLNEDKKLLQEELSQKNELIYEYMDRVENFKKQTEENDSVVADLKKEIEQLQQQNSNLRDNQSNLNETAEKSDRQESKKQEDEEEEQSNQQEQEIHQNNESELSAENQKDEDHSNKQSDEEEEKSNHSPEQPVYNEFRTKQISSYGRTRFQKKPSEEEEQEKDIDSNLNELTGDEKFLKEQMQNLKNQLEDKNEQCQLKEERINTLIEEVAGFSSKMAQREEEFNQVFEENETYYLKLLKRKNEEYSDLSRQFDIQKDQYEQIQEKLEAIQENSISKQ